MNRCRQIAIKELTTSRYATNELGCWLWTGKLSDKGYGFIEATDPQTRETRIYSVHRLSYERFKGKLPPKHRVRHSCNQRPCYKPEHLLPGTAKQNTADMVQCGRAAWQKKKAVKSSPELVPMINPLAAQVLENEVIRTSGKGKRRQRKMDKMFAAFARKHAMPWTRADRLKLTADLESEEEYKPYEL